MKTHKAQVISGVLVPLSGSELEKMLRDREGEMVDVRLGSRSLPRHHLLMAYASWLHEDYFSDRFPTFDGWRSDFSKEIGWTVSHDYINKVGEKVTEITPRSWSPDNNTREEHKRLMELVGEAGQAISGIGLDEFAAKRNQFVEGRA